MNVIETQIEMDSGKEDSFTINKENGLAVFLAALFLAVILFLLFAPVIAVSPGPKRSSHSLSKLKQLATGLQIYAIDYNDLLPDKLTWQTSLNPYVKNEQLFLPPYKELPGTYAMNPSLSGVKWLPRQEHELAPLLFESRLKGPNSFGGVKDIRLEEGKVGLALSDGSARRATAAEAEKLNWSPNWPK